MPATPDEEAREYFGDLTLSEIKSMLDASNEDIGYLRAAVSEIYAVAGEDKNIAAICNRVWARFN